MKPHPKPRLTANELAEMVWNYGQNFFMRKVRETASYQPAKYPKRFLETYKLTLEKYQIGVKQRFVSTNFRTHQLQPF